MRLPNNTPEPGTRTTVYSAKPPSTNPYVYVRKTSPQDNVWIKKALSPAPRTEFGTETRNWWTHQKLIPREDFRFHPSGRSRSRSSTVDIMFAVMGCLRRGRAAQIPPLGKHPVCHTDPTPEKTWSTASRSRNRIQIIQVPDIPALNVSRSLEGRYCSHLFRCGYNSIQPKSKAAIFAPEIARAARRRRKKNAFNRLHATQARGTHKRTKRTNAQTHALIEWTPLIWVGCWLVHVHISEAKKKKLKITLIRFKFGPYGSSKPLVTHGSIACHSQSNVVSTRSLHLIRTCQKGTSLSRNTKQVSKRLRGALSAGAVGQ